MATRHNMRPRSVNFDTKLLIVRAVEDLDPGPGPAGMPVSAAEGEAGGSHAGAAEGSVVHAENAPRGAGMSGGLGAAAGGPDGGAPHGGGGQIHGHGGGHGHGKPKAPAADILTPACHAVCTYRADYPRGYRQPAAYVRTPDGGWLGPGFVEYDLEAEDLDWLAAYNAGQERLAADSLELVLHRLETAWQTAAERLVISAADKGAALTSEERLAVAGGNTAALPREAALASLKGLSLRAPVLGALYDYWARKRALKLRPLLRRLQPAPSAGDTNPFTVFRQRENKTRPQTRRRRENDAASLTRMHELRESLAAGRGVLEAVCARELIKLERITLERQLQAAAVADRHGTRDTTAAAIAAAGAVGPWNAPVGAPPPPGLVPPWTAPGGGVSLSLGLLAAGLPGVLTSDRPPCPACRKAHKGDCDPVDIHALAPTLFVPRPAPPPEMVGPPVAGTLPDAAINALLSAPSPAGTSPVASLLGVAAGRGGGTLRLGRGGRIIYDRSRALA